LPDHPLHKLLGASIPEKLVSVRNEKRHQRLLIVTEVCQISIVLKKRHQAGGVGFDEAGYFLRHVFEQSFVVEDKFYRRLLAGAEIGRASCRERGSILG